MKTSTSLVVFSTLLLFLLTALSPDAQAQRKLYRWTDADGKVHYTDQLPPEAARDKQEQLNQQGMTVKTTERALTPEEQAAWDAEQERLELEQKLAAEMAQMDSVLLSSYPQEKDLERAYQERFDLIEQSLESARVGIRSQEKSLQELLAHAADLERNGKPVPTNIRDSVQRARVQVKEQRNYLERRQQEHVKLENEYQERLLRYRELKQEAEKKKG